MKNLLSFSICVLLSFFGLKAQTINPTYSNVDYTGMGNSKQMLDIYIPSGVTSPTATIVHIHGGAFLSGSKGTSQQSSYQNLYNNGYICVDINYRLSSDSIWPAQIFDCKAAIRYLKANAEKYHIDTNKIGVIGESAGGYLVAMLGTTAEEPSLEGLHLGNTNVTSRVHAVVDLFGPINFLTMDSEATALGFSLSTNSATSPESKLMGAAVQTIPELVKKANPTTYISADDASFFISAGSADKNIPYTQGQNFNQALAAIIGNDRTSFELLAGAGHGGTVWFTNEQNAKYLAFFQKALTGLTNIEENFYSAINPEISIAPNPVIETLSINIPGNNSFEIMVYNWLGQIVYTQSNVTAPVDISCKNIPNGLYFVKAISAGKVLSINFTKQ